MKIGIVSGDYLRADKSHDGKEKWGGAGWARLGQYVDALRVEHDVRIGHLWLRGEYLTVQDEYENVFYPEVIIMQRLMHDGLDKSIHLGRKSGQIVINDVDDWYWGLDPRNAAYKASHPRFNKQENIAHYKKVIAASSYVTVSTPYLLDRVNKFTKQPVTLINNYVDVNRFNKRTHSDMFDVEVGWAGSTDHRSGDLETMRGLLSQFTQDGRARLVHGGHLPTSRSFAESVGVPDEYVRTNERVNAEDYPKLLDFDIGIVPLRDTPFNYAKSDIKGLEYAASGIPFIASALPNYSKLYKDWGGEGMFIARRPKDWIRSIQTLLDYDKRVEHAEAAYENVKSRDISVGVDTLLSYLGTLT
jgi:glycosyltransferase involved in cell wall biosynthesis